MFHPLWNNDISEENGGYGVIYHTPDWMIDFMNGSNYCKLHAKDAAWFDVELEELDDGVVILRLIHEDIVLESKLQNISTRNDVMFKYNTLEYDENLSFDHSEIIVCALMQLRRWIKNTSLAFCLLPEHFTLTQLQQVHEVVSGEKLLTPAFRRKVSVYVEETGKMTSDEGA